MPHLQHAHTYSVVFIREVMYAWRGLGSKIRSIGWARSLITKQFNSMRQEWLLFAIIGLFVVYQRLRENLSCGHLNGFYTRRKFIGRHNG